jgi:manganese/zinc/iron transport system permease protein
MIMSPQVEIQIIAMIVAVACCIPGVVLVLRKMAMMSDAITHTILLGIVIGFLVVYDLSSPLLIIGATLMGLLTVYLVELLTKTKLISEDSAIGIIFPFLFSIAIILISRYAGNVHLDIDSVLLGELAFAPFNRLRLFGIDIGAKNIYTMGAILLVNISLIAVFFKEIKIAVFDPELAAVLGFSPVLIQYGLMGSVSITTVGAFDAVGSILVIAFMIGPPVSAYLLTDDLKKMFFISAGIGVLNALGGYQMAVFYDVSIAGSMALFTGITFLVVFIVAPHRGVISVMRRRKFQSFDFAQKTMLFHILYHEGKINESVENGVSTIYEHLNIPKDSLKKMIQQLVSDGKLREEAGVYKLTDNGRKYTIESYESIVQSFNSEFE